MISADIVDEKDTTIDIIPHFESKNIVHAYWTSFFDDLWPEDSEVICSNCHNRFRILDLDVDDFEQCPECRAIMDSSAASTVNKKR